MPRRLKRWSSGQAAGVGRDAVAGPLLERGHEGVLGEVLGEREVSGHPGEGADQDGPTRPARPR